MSDIREAAVLDSADLKEGEHKAVDFLDEGKVLLSKVQGQVYATSAFCTHYGAPLEKGVLSHDGRVTCPWHGACFKVSNGDIEDAPGLDSLWSYSVREADGKIYVKASEKEVKSKVGRKAAKFASANKTSKETVVIVGGGSGGIHTVESLRMNGFAGDIVLISKDDHPPFDRTKLSKALIDDVNQLIWRTPEDIINEFSVDFQMGTTVDKIDTAANTVTTSAGKTIKYDKLILSPGCLPKKLGIEGKDLDGVVTIRHVADAKKVTSTVNKDSNVVIIGTSFIGMEVAMALKKLEPKSITLVGHSQTPFSAILGEEIGTAIMENMKKQDIKFIMKAGIEKVLPSDSDPQHCGYLQIKGQDPIPADLVIMGTGAYPNTAFLKDSGFELERDGGITVDEYLKVKGYDNIYAIGDIAHHPQYPDKFQRRVEHWNVAGNHGRTVAHNIAKPNETPKAYTRVPIFWSMVIKGLRYLGTGAGFDDSYTVGDPSALKFVTYQAKDGKVTAVATMQNDPIVSKSSELMRLGLMPSLEEIRNGKNVLDIELKA